MQWRTLSTFLETLTFVSACWWFCFSELPRPPVPADEFEQSCNMWTEFQRSGIFDEVVQWRTLSTFLETLTVVSARRWFCFPELPRPPVPADEFEQSCNMWTEFQRSGIFDEVVQWRTLSTFLETLTFVSACWWFCFPELPRPPVPADEFEQFEQSCNMWTEFQRSGIFDEVVQWRTLSTFLETLTFVSARWWLCFPELPRPPVPADEFEQSCNMWTEWCCFAVLRACVLFVALAVSLALAAGSDTVAQPFLHRSMEIDATAQSRDLDGDKNG